MEFLHTFHQQIETSLSEETSQHLGVTFLCLVKHAHSACLTYCTHAVDLCYSPNLFVIVGVGRVISHLCLFSF